MKSLTTSPSARGILVLAGGAAAALMLAAGTASAATGGQGASRLAEPTAKPVAKGHEHSMVLHRHHAAHGAAGHLDGHGVQHIGHRYLSHHLTHHVGVIRLPLHPLSHRVHHHARWRRLHHGHAAAGFGRVHSGGQARLTGGNQLQGANQTQGGTAAGH